MKVTGNTIRFQNAEKLPDTRHTWEARNKFLSVLAIVGNAVTADAAVATAEHDAATTGTQLGEEVADCSSVIDGDGLLVIAVARGKLTQSISPNIMRTS